MNSVLRMSMLALLVTGTGCATMYPVAPRWTGDEIKDAAKPDPFIGANAIEARKLVQGTRQLLSDAAHHRRIADIAASEVTFYGTLLGVLGLSLDKAGLTNTGGGAATLGTLFSGRYKLADQEVVFRKAEARAACLELALAEMSWGDGQVGFHGEAFMAPATGLAAKDATKAGTLFFQAQMETDAVPRLVAENLRRLTNDLRVALAAIPLTSMTRAQMLAALKSATDAEKKAEEATAAAYGGGATTEQGAELLGALAATLSVEEKFDACFVEHAQ
jgi:hypothetical protein